MKVLYAFPEPLPLDRARGIQVAHTVTELARAGVDVTLYHAPGPGHPTLAYGLTGPDRLQLRAVSRALPWPLGRVHSNRVFAHRLIRTAGAAFDTDIVVVRHLKLASLLLRLRPGLRLVYEAHEVFGDTATASKAARRRAEESAVMRGAAAIVCNSRATAARLVELYGQPARLETIPNGVDWIEALPSKNWEKAREHIVYSGSLFPWKGAAELVEAATRLPGFAIELIGGDAQAISRLSALARPDGATLNFAGHIPHSQVLERLSRQCIAVLPNRPGTDSSFTSPIKLFEYMAAGCAIVASDLPSVREILAEDEAAWTPPGDAAALALALSKLAADPARARQLGERVREKARGYTWAARAQKLGALFAELGREA
jgi:glycosyltransferase involved in cell wall biosynthesis